MDLGYQMSKKLTDVDDGDQCLTIVPLDEGIQRKCNDDLHSSVLEFSQYSVFLQIFFAKNDEYSVQVD